MNKQEFLKDLNEIIEDEIFIGSTIEDLNHEISQNHWSFSMSQELANDFTVEELKDFFIKVIDNRTNQIANSKSNHGMFFYFWFDWQSSRLRLNLISDFHERLPFGREYNVFNYLEPIIEEYLNYSYHDGIISMGASDEDKETEEDIEVNPLNVFVKKISKK